MKSLYHIILTLAMLATTIIGCSDEDMLMTVDMENTQEQNATFSVNLNISVPDPIKVTSRNAEYDAIESMTLLCFNSQGKLISISNPLLDKENRTFTADITYTTRVIHLVANQIFNGLKLGSSTEIEIANMVSTAERMIYWARVEIPSSVQGSANIEAWFNSTFNAQNPIMLLRNQAKVSIESAKDSEENPYFIVKQFKVYNTWNKGTVAPYHQTKNAFPTITDESFGLDEWAKEDYIRIPVAQITEDLTKITIGDDDTDGKISPLYVYETESAKNTFIVFQGCNATENPNDPANLKWWRVSFTDVENKPLMIRRNHHYAVKITGALSKGYATLDEAISDDAATANDAYLGISNEVTAVTNGKASLTVQETYFAKPNGTPNLSFIFNINKSKNDAEDIFEQELSITWEGTQNVSSMTEFIEFVKEEDANEDELAGYTLKRVNLNESTGGYKELQGKIYIPLNSLPVGDNTPLTGVVKIKYGNKLQRKVTVTVIPKYDFEFNRSSDVDETLTPTNPYTQPIAALTFTIPASYPEEMYPFNVLISSNDFTITNSEGTGLPIIYPGDGGYIESAENDMGYKYVYQVTSPDVRTHTIKLISSHGNVINVTELGSITLESQHFNALSVNDISLLCPPQENNGGSED